MTVESTPFRALPDLERALVALVEEHLLDGSTRLDAAAPLSSAGLDSMAVMQLLLLIEDRFGLWLPEEDLTHENFASIRTLARAVARRLAERERVL
ncbi:MAG: phosphopantetheine-binding protein [Thermodesulfobacteriota bacterium]